MWRGEHERRFLHIEGPPVSIDDVRVDLPIEKRRRQQYFAPLAFIVRNAAMMLSKEKCTQTIPAQYDIGYGQRATGRSTRMNFRLADSYRLRFASITASTMSPPV